MEIDSEGLVGFFEFMFEHLDEKQRRLLAGGMARLIGRGGPTVVAETAGMSRKESRIYYPRDGGLGGVGLWGGDRLGGPGRVLRVHVRAS